MAHPPPSHLYGIVDMGSNGIRFSISDLSPPTARSLPTVFQSRLGVSLFDAQYTNIESNGTRGPIPQPVIDSVIEALQRFKTTCVDFGVPESNIKVLATEATRTAVNSVDFRRQIKEVMGWEVEMLAKEEEGRIGAMGVASSFPGVEGLVMDLGGGSTQITWMVSRAGAVQTSPRGSISFPYGAAALTRQLASLESPDQPPSAKHQLAAEMQSNFQTAYRSLAIPSSLHAKAERQGGFTLYLSGGGFRGWGYLLMSQSRVTPYPIPIINGFQVTKHDFQRITQLRDVAATQEDIFRVSKRRAAQVPAVAFLVNELVLAIPGIREIRFCQGGVREGFLFSSLDEETRAMDPLRAASAKFGSRDAAAIAELLRAALPTTTTATTADPDPDQMGRWGQVVPASFSRALIRALADLLYEHSSLPKESASLAALYCPIAGVLASAHGISHPDRALLALMLAQRWSGDLAPPHESLRDRLRQLLSGQEVWWCNYLGHVAGLVGDVYPAGRIEGERLQLRAEWAGGLGKKGVDQGIRLVIMTKAGDPMTSPGTLREALHAIEDVGKKKHWVGGREGFGLRIEVRVEALIARS